MSVIPEWPETDRGISNFDHSIDDGLEDELRSQEVVATYAGWEFNGKVWFDRDAQEFVCEVWRYHEPVDVVRTQSLAEMISAVSDKWGWE